MTGGVEFRIEAMSWALLTGNLFSERMRAGGRVSEIWNWAPFNMTISRSTMNPLVPLRYVFNKDGRKARAWDVDPNTGTSEMMHWGLFNPTNDKAFQGLAPMAAAASSGDQLNAANKWRFNLFMNDCRPAGVMSTDQPVTTSDEKTLSKRLIEKAKSKFLILGGGLKWTQLGMTPKDADYLAGSKFNKQEICEVFGVPSQLLGIEGSQTFANFEEARYSFWLMTVLPLLDLYYSELNRWLAPEYGEDVEIFYDESDITALDYVRERKVAQALETDVLTINEKRALMGFEAIDEGEADQVFVDPSKLPLGFDVFMPEEAAAEDAAKAFVRMGMDRKEAELKAHNIFHERSCHHRQD